MRKIVLCSQFLVYAVEASSLADWTELVVAHNNLSDVIQVLKGRIEELTLPEKVDIIISEWMGTFLIFVRNLEKLNNFSRSRCLNPYCMQETIGSNRYYIISSFIELKGGILFPSSANIYLAPISMEDFFTEKVSFWKNVYGVDMSVLM